MWHRALSHRFALPALVALAVLLVLPTLRSGLIGDDFLFRELITGFSHHPQRGAPFGLYTFADGHAASVQRMRDVGLYQWWVADGALMSFWRPLSELSHWLDYVFWPSSPSLMHAHSVLWYGLLVYLLGRFYRLLDASPARAGLSTLVFAVGTTHLFTVMWLAARNQLIAGCFILLALGAHHRWRQGRGQRHAWLGVLWLILGLLSAEAAIALLGYLLAYALTLEPAGRSWARRLVSLLPYLAVIVLWRAVYHHLGYGSAGSGGYIDPGADPLRFAQALLLRLPALLIADLYGVSSTVFHLMPDRGQIWYAVLAALAVAGTVWLMHVYRLWREPLARFHGLGALLALIPVCAASTNDRLLLNAEFGLSALLAMCFEAILARHKPKAEGPWKQVGKALAVVLMGIHLVVYPAATAALAVTTPLMLDMAARLEPLSLPDARAQPDSRVILVNAPKALFVGYYPAIRRYHGMGNAASMQALTSGDQVVTVSTVDERTLRVSGSIGLGEPVSRDFKRLPFKVGDQVRAGHFTVIVEAVTPNGNVQTARFVFDTPLRDAPWQLYAWGASGYEPFSLPPAGQSVTLAKVDLGKLVKKKLGTLL